MQLPAHTVVDETLDLPADYFPISVRVVFTSSDTFFSHMDIPNNPRLTISGKVKSRHLP